MEKKLLRISYLNEQLSKSCIWGGEQERWSSWVALSKWWLWFPFTLHAEPVIQLSEKMMKCELCFRHYSCSVCWHTCLTGASPSLVAVLSLVLHSFVQYVAWQGSSLGQGGFSQFVWQLRVFGTCLWRCSVPWQVIKPNGFHTDVYDRISFLWEAMKQWPCGIITGSWKYFS